MGNKHKHFYPLQVSKRVMQTYIDVNAKTWNDSLLLREMQIEGVEALGNQTFQDSEDPKQFNTS